MKKTTIIALIILLIAGLFVACDNETIVDDEFNPAIEITSETKTLIPGNKYKTVANTTIANRITIEGKGTVTIILTEGTTLTIEKGISVTGDQELYIEGTGKLVATGDVKSAGIGGGENEDGGTVVIQGGSITANGGEGGAGIGGGKGGKSGTVIIQKQDGKEAPEVTTKGGSNDADGIGNGDGATGDPKEIKLDGVGLESSDDDHTWYDYSQNHFHKQYMRSYVGAIITFNANGGTGDMAAQVVHVNKDENLKANTYTRTGMEFKGWNTKADGSGKPYANEGSININADITLYAQWETAPAGNYITSETTSIQSGKTWTIQGDEVVNNNRIKIDGNEETTILLPAGKKLTLTKGINVITPQTLIIDGDSTGILISGGPSTTPEGAAGIGGYGDSEKLYICGTIIIKNGDITAYGGNGENGGAGIGGGYRGNGGTINITGGKVEANAGTNAAGIGGGLEGSGGVITITGGDVTAYCGTNDGAGIGGGKEGSGGTISISGGNVTAGSNYNGAGIGGGRQGSGGTITISDAATVVAKGGTNGEGIGKGYNGASSGTLTLPGVTFVSDDNITWVIYNGTNSKRYMRTATILSSSTTEWKDGYFYTLSGDTLTISDERVIVTGAVNLYLPAGKTLIIPQGITVANTNSLTIDGTGTGTLTINGVDTNNSGIGGDWENPNAGTITIKGGVVNTTGGENGAGIGGGKVGSGGTINIDGGTITSRGNSAAGIGGGYNSSSIGQITITGGSVDSKSNFYGAGIGGGSHGLTGTISISGGTVVAVGDYKSAGIGSGDGNESATPNSIVITISGDANVTATGGDGGAGIGGGYEAVGGTINIQGGTVVATGMELGAGIGGGDGGAGGSISISGDTTVTATADCGDAESGAAAGIGGGDNGAGGTISISITSGSVTATGGSVGIYTGNGIGGGDLGDIGTLTISGTGLKLWGKDNSGDSWVQINPPYTTRNRFMEADYSF